jgi:hypothetical protein
MRKARATGQALLVVLAFLATLTGGFLVVFSVGQVVNDKIRLVNAADAAAFSAAQWQARSLNYQAYLNRAIVANEVAIAQMVSLRSWSRYMDRTISNASRIGGFVPPLAATLQSLERGWDAIDRAIAGVAPIEGVLSHWNVDVLANAQAIAHQQAPIAAAELVAQVAALQEPRAQVYEATRLMQVRNAAQWQHRFTARLQRGGGDLHRFAELLMDARDGFSARRTADLAPVGSPLQVSRRGGTDLIGEYAWRGLDTLSAHIDLGIVSQEIPLGWGAAEQRRLPVLQQGNHGNSLRRNPRASRLARRELAPVQAYQGLPEIRDVVQPTRQDERRLGYSVALRLPQSQIDTADRLLVPHGLWGVAGEPARFQSGFSASALHALGSAEVYFRRPQARVDGRHEFASLFSPYWQARLATTPDLDRQLTAGQRGLQFDPFGLQR